MGMNETASNYETLSHAALMSKRDGAVRMWTIVPGKSAKLVRDGVSYARIDALTDGRFVARLNGVESELASWSACCAWLQSHAVAAALAGEIWI